jgi:hypothetical protein
LAQVAPSSRTPEIPPAQRIHARNGVVVAQESRASRIGVEILDRGGNAVDAAVAVGFALAVTYPRAGNIGGGGFMVIHLAKTGQNVTIDYRETAPAAATETMFLDATGEPDPKKSRDSALSIGVPGTVAGLALVFIAVVTSVSSHLDMLGRDFGTEVHWVAVVLSVLVNALVLALMLRLSTPRDESLRDVLPGATLIAVLWQLLQLVGGLYVEHVIKKANEMNAVFALVLGLLALVYIATVLAMLGVEVNVVLVKRLYPRALLTPFTDRVHLTEADERVYREYAQAQRHKGFEEIDVSFGDHPRPG